MKVILRLFQISTSRYTHWTTDHQQISGIVEVAVSYYIHISLLHNQAFITLQYLPR